MFRHISSPGYGGARNFLQNWKISTRCRDIGRQSWHIFGDFGSKRPKMPKTAIFGPKNEKIKNPEMCVPADSQDTPLVEKWWNLFNFMKSYLKKCVSKNDDFARFWAILGRFGPKSPNTCQLWRPISRQHVDIFQFRKKFLAPHNQEIKICRNKRNLKFFGRPPPLSP